MTDDRLYLVERCADDPDAPVIVLVHGVFDSSVSFERVVDDLVPAYSVITYDRRGWARSRDATPAAALDDHARDLLSAIGERPATVVGHSYGGAVALLAAVRRPDLVAALGLFEPSMQWVPWWPTHGDDRRTGARRAGPLPGRPRGPSSSDAQGTRPRPGTARARAHARPRRTARRSTRWRCRVSWGEVVSPRQWRVEATDRLTRRARLRPGGDRERRAHRTPHPAEEVRRLRPAGRGARRGGAADARRRAPIRGSRRPRDPARARSAGFLRELRRRGRRAHPRVHGADLRPPRVGPVARRRAAAVVGRPCARRVGGDRRTARHGGRAQLRRRRRAGGRAPPSGPRRRRSRCSSRRSPGRTGGPTTTR